MLKVNLFVGSGTSLELTWDKDSELMDSRKFRAIVGNRTPIP